MYFKPSRKNQDFLFLPLPLKPVSLANGHLRVRENTKYQNKKEQTNLDLMTTLSRTLVLQEHNPKKLKKYDGLNDNLRGAVAEKLCYEDFKRYFKEANESVLLISGLDLQHRDGKKNTSSEKDVIILNYTYCYIMGVEVKSDLTAKTRDKKSPVEKCSKQIPDALSVLRTWFEADADEDLCFVPMIYCLTMDQDVAEGLKEQKDFMFCKSNHNKSFSEKMSTIPQMVSKFRGSSTCLNPEKFKRLANYLIFRVSITELPVKFSLIKKLRSFRDDIGSYDNLLLWGFLNPAQQAILDCESLNKVILTAPYSCGKTTVLTGRALKLQ